MSHVNEVYPYILMTFEWPECDVWYGVGDINKLYSFVSLNSDLKVA